ncbi:membrane-spanning 4-domains subfamily A member 4D-like isoform X2 [Pseudophryne corroboree]|uniref:membrane-spanning 4-domains subfamily A member 4D-like isoform X2 n=1 Tax=Pseudophryne corroboree TaxID=495146 RepID=UPI0030817BBB
MSAPRSELGGFVTIAQDEPQNNAPPKTRKNSAPTTTSKRLVKFFQGEPESLGVTQIIIGVTQIVLGIVLTAICHVGRCIFFSIFIFTGVTYWSGIMYIISGSLSVAASYKPTVGKPSQDCDGNFRPLPLLLGIVSLQFILTVLEFCVTLSTSIFGCKAVCGTSNNEVNVVIYQTTSLSAPNTTAASTDGDIKIQG